MKLFRSFFIPGFFIILAVNSLSAQEIASIAVKINPEKAFQTLHSFGASDAWRCHFIGQYWPEEKREQMAEWLFSKEFDEHGNPKGIGLSMWRFNLGAGSMEQGDSSYIFNEWRRAESFFTEDYSGYDWSKQAGQQWFMRKAAEYGVENFTLFSNAPPVNYSINGRAFADKGMKNMNIKPDLMEDFAVYMVDVADYFNRQNIPVNYISPVNESQWGWDGGDQEGSPATNEDIFELTRFLSEKLNSVDFDCNISIAETAVLMFLSNFKVESRWYGPFANKYKPSSDQFRKFAGKDSPLYVGDLPHVEKALAGHSYFTTWPVRKLINKRKNLYNTIQKTNPDFGFWQTEFCILEKNDDIGQGGTRDLGMPTALYVARVMHYDLVVANAVTWQWWTAITQCDYKDGLVYLDYEGGFDKEKLKYDGNVHDSKTLWAMGNYSRFVRPGMQRIEADYLEGAAHKSNAYGVMISAYKDEDKVVMVAVNYSEDSQPLNIQLSGRDINGQLATYVTSMDKDLEKVMVNYDNLVLEPRSVTTVVLE